MKVIHATPRGEVAFAAVCLETKETAVIITTPYRATPRQLRALPRSEEK